jgi:hypothetical protein
VTAPLRVVSYGGGVQSTALLVLAAQDKIDFKTFLFANVGDDSEHPDTLAFVRELAMPYGKAHGIEIIELSKERRDGTPVTLMGKLTNPTSRSVEIPVRMGNGAPGNRTCTAEFKMNVITKWLKAHGATKDSPATVAIGFSTDEVHRVGRRHESSYESPVHPLLGLGMSRSNCVSLIERSGLPVPRKSACFFCPFHRPLGWAEMRRDEPKLFWRSVELERTLNDTRDRLGKDHVYLSRFGRPLDEAIGMAQPSLFDDPDGPETCDEGHCWT